MGDRELTHKERVDLAVCYFGLYMLGMSGDEVDVRCAMDNFQVPWLDSQLNEQQREILNKLYDPIP